MQLWIVGRFFEFDPDKSLGERARWAWTGVFSTRDMAVNACEQENDFIFPAVLDRCVAHEFGALAGQEYPLNPRGSEPADS